jgi:hypothetical protein
MTAAPMLLGLHATGFSEICGEVMQVLPENNIIVIEVRAKDWILLDTW